MAVRRFSLAQQRDAHGLLSCAEDTACADRAGVDHQDLAVAVDVLLVVVPGEDQKAVAVVA